MRSQFTERDWYVKQLEARRIGLFPVPHALRLPWVFSDGGASTSKLNHSPTGDCVVRAVALAANLPYDLVFAHLTEIKKWDIRRKLYKPDENPLPSDGVDDTTSTFVRYMTSLGFLWVDCPDFPMLTNRSIPLHEPIVTVRPQHYSSVVNGTIMDRFSPYSDDPWAALPLIEGYWRRA